MQSHRTIYATTRSVVLAVVLAGLAAPYMGAQTASPSQAPQQRPPADVIKELDALKQRVEQLESELKSKAPQEQPSTDETAKPAAEPSAERTVPPADKIGSADAKSEPIADLRPLSPVPLDAQAAQTPAPAAPAAEPAPAPVDLVTPFAYADYTWMNAVPRNHDEVLDGKYFSGEFRVDTNYIYDWQRPIDHTLIGTTEGERTGELVIQAINVGGDFHAGNMQGRLLTQFGAVSTAVPRNDASYSRGQWQLQDAYRYLTDAYAGYHTNVSHGLNFQAGIFLSYIGLFSYYTFDNWAYQPSYVSSNTPWFFSGARMQYFPTNKLKIEPWFINGWQTYAKYNGRHGIGGQILWRPTGNLDFVWNTYALGRDTPGAMLRSRYHADWSQEWKYWENPNKLMHRMAFTVTEDFGCETGGGVVCHGGNANTPAQNFLGIMAYHRWWFDKDRFGATIGGGVMNNPGRYLVLLPPINGASATTGTPYFTQNPGDQFKAYDFQLTFDYMPSQWVTWRVEFTQRGANVPYFTGPGGITPQVAPGVYYNTGDPTQIIPGFTPDLRKHENRLLFSLLVKL
ncbi:MAG TPA: outer membrane beta-barrel protein [Bryobacteraceae bacterium]|nr:outer membrane beta-barrel protein [Bryobacteraceae bacterium]